VDDSETILVEDQLRRKGFNLFSIMDPSQWSLDLRNSFESLDIDLPTDSRLILLGAGGPAFWEIVHDRHWQKKDPIDRYTICAVEKLVDTEWGGKSIDWLYPGPKPIPLQRLCRYAGWSHPSLLGLDIHPIFGTWFACRAAFIIKIPLKCTPSKRNPSPCDACLDKPCQGRCPAGAVRDRSEFGVEECGSHRVTDQSSCAHRCLSRSACPIGVSWHYSNEQLDYHGSISLASIKENLPIKM
jgi:epoxyqueuosine reductase